MPVPAGSTPPAVPTSGPIVYDPVLSRVRLTPSDLSLLIPTVTVERSTNQVTWSTVRGGSAVPVTGGTATLDDYEFAADVPNYYRVLTNLAVWDTFTRSTSNGWGTAESGQPWTIDTGAAGDFSTNGSEAVTSHSTISDHQMVVDVGSTDQLIDVRFRIPVAPTGGSAAVILDLRARNSPGNNYYTRISVNAAGVMSSSLNETVGGSGGTLGTGPSLTLNTAHTYGIRMEVLGSIVRYVFWNDTTGPGPTAWSVQVTDASVTTGTQVGLFSIPLSVTNPLPYVVLWDNVAMVDGQQHQVMSASITPVLDAVWLKSLVRPFLNRTVTPRDFSPLRRPGRGGVFGVVGRSDPIAVTDVRGSKRFTLDINTYSDTEAEELDLLLATGDILLVHVPTTGRLRVVPGGYVTVGDSEELVLPTLDLVHRVFSVGLTRCAAPGPDIVGATITCAGILNLYASCSALLSAHPTCADVLSLVGSPGDVLVA